MKVQVKSFSRVRLFATPWTVTYQALRSMGFSINTKKPTCAYKLQKFNQDQSCSVKVGRGRKKRGRREGWVILILSSSENQKHVSSILLKNIIQKYKSRSSSLFLSACLQVGGPQISILSDLFFWLHYMACGILVP